MIEQTLEEPSMAKGLNQASERRLDYKEKAEPAGITRRKFLKSAGALSTASILRPNLENYLKLALQATALTSPSLASCAGMKTATIDDLVNISYPEPIPQEQFDSFLKETKTAYHTLVDFLGISQRKVYINIGDFERTHVDRRIGWVMNYSTSLLRSGNHVNVWHELVHSLTQSGAEFYPEGLAEYIKIRLANRRDKDAHSWVNGKFKEYGKKVSVLDIFNERIGGIERYDPRIVRQVNYSVAASFVRYLVEDVLHGDIKKFMEFYMAMDYSDSAHKKFFGKDLRQLDSAWMEMLDKYGDKPKIFKSY